MLAAITLAACAATTRPAWDANAPLVCNPPPAIAGHEPRLCFWPGSDGEAWCTYGVARCDGTWTRQGCEAEWVQAWGECHLPLRDPRGEHDA